MSLNGFGDRGVYASRPGYDVLVAAETGLLQITGESDGDPVKTGVALTDLTTGLYAHGAIIGRV